MTLQNIPLIQVYDYLNLSGSPSATAAAAAGNLVVTARLQYDQATYASPVVGLLSQPVTATVGSDGYWTMYLAANDKINPANTTFLITIPGYAPYQISVPSTSVPANGWQSSAILVTSPSALGPNTPTGHVSSLLVDTTFTLGVQSIAYAATVTPDATAAAHVVIGALTGNITVANPTGPTVGQILTFEFTQDATGSRTVTWGSAFNVGLWTINPAPSSVSTISFKYDGVSAKWQALSSLQEVQKVINILDFGAVSGSDASTPINNAITAASSGSRILFPDGTWPTTGWALNWGAIETQAITFAGNNRGSTILSHTGTGIGFDFDRCHGLVLENMTLKAGASTTQVIRYNGFRPRWRDVEVDGTSGAAGCVGVELRDSPTTNAGCYYGEFDAVFVHDCNGANWRLKTYFGSGATPTVNAHTFNACLSRTSASDGWVLDHATGNVWNGGDSENNTGYGFNIVGVARGSRILGTYVENNTAGNFNIPAGAAISDLEDIWLVPAGMQTGGSTTWTNLGRGSVAQLPFDGTYSRLFSIIGPISTWQVANASLPSASTYPAGSVAYDSTHLVPVWNSGASWVDSLGNPPGTTYTFDALKPTAAISQAFDRTMIDNNTAALASGTLYMTAVYIPSATVVTNLSWLSGTTALVLGATPHYWVALFDSSLNLLRQSTDNTAATIAASSLITTALSSTFTTTYSGLHYIGIMVNSGGGTQPTFAGKGAIVQSGINLAPKLSGTSTTGLTTTAPNPAASITVISQRPWGYPS